MGIQLNHIDHGNGFDFGKTAADYAKYRDIYPESLYRKLQAFGVVVPGSRILDVGTGTGVLPRALKESGAIFTGTDVAAEQIEMARAISGEGAAEYLVSPAEETPFAPHSFDVVTACQCFWYFEAEKFARELERILVPGGLFCKIAMEWLPFEDETARLTEELVLRYNPHWSGGAFRPEPYRFPAWAVGRFELETLHAYREELPFTVDGWCGRIRSCRGVGASLPPERVAAFDRELRGALEARGRERFTIRHHIQFEVYRGVIS